MISSRRKRSGKWVESVEPMFSRYLFIRIEPGTTSITSIRSTRGVTELVQFGNELVAVPEKFISVLLQTIDPETGVHDREPDFLRPGNDVELTNGPLANFKGIFKAADGQTRAIILMSILGEETEVVVPVDQLGRAS